VQGRHAPVGLKAQVLRDREPFVPSGAMLGSVIAPDCVRPPAKGGWRQADVRRAINAAEKAGLQSYRVEIAPDGTIAIVVGLAPE
jgi:hypothetical protein